MADEPTREEKEETDEPSLNLEDSEWSVDRSYRSPSPSLVNEEELSEREQEEHTDVEVVDIGFIDTRTTRTDANDTMSRWLVTARTSQEAQQMAVAVKKEDRDKLSADALLKLQKSSTIGMTNKFALMNHTTDDQLVECYNLSLRIEELKTRLKKNDTISGFDIFEQVLTQPTTLMPRELPLIAQIDDLTEALVRSSMKFKRYYGQPYDVQDLQWSQELIEQSCEEDLRIKVMERLRPVPDVEQGGALFYFIMIQLIQTDAEQAVRTLTEKLEKLSLKSLAGENIFTACSLIRGVMDRLKTVNKVPHDVEATILDILQTSSVDDFNSVFKTLQDNRFLGLSVQQKTVEQILVLAELLYTRLLTKGVWKGVGSAGKSSFMAKEGEEADSDQPDETDEIARRLREKVCWNCGKKGHLSRDCRSPRQGERHGRGRGGRGRGSGEDRRVDWKKTPPKDGDRHEKTVNAILWKWCGVCGTWNTTHATEEHVPRGQANLADDTADGDDTSQQPDPGETPRVSFVDAVSRRLNGGSPSAG
jgi:hypothetical protein